MGTGHIADAQIVADAQSAVHAQSVVHAQNEGLLGVYRHNGGDVYNRGSGMHNM